MHSQLFRPSSLSGLSDGGVRTGQPAGHARSGQVPAWSARAGRTPVQARLTMGRPGDAFEQEADRFAERVTAAPTGAVQRCGADCGCPDCRQAQQDPGERVQLKTDGGASDGSVAATGVQQAVAGSGSALAPADRSFFGARLGADFSHVRIHTGPDAERSAAALSAHAYTVGNHIVFNRDRFQPGEATGRRLLAHELVHVLQQQGGAPALQREPEDEKESPKSPGDGGNAGGSGTQAQVARVDVALLLDDESVSQQAAAALAPVVLRVHDAADMKSKLQGFGKPIGTLYFVTHSNRAGEVQFVSSIGTISWESLSSVAATVKGSLPADKAPQVIDLRGCQIGQATQELGRLATALGAGSAKGNNCWTFDNAVGPIFLDGTPITDPSQITKDNEALFNKGLRMLINDLKSEDNKLVKNCIIGLGKGERADTQVAKIKRIYFAAKGSLTAEWVSPQYDKTWQAGSICYKDLTASTKPCNLVSVSPSTSGTP